MASAKKKAIIFVDGNNWYHNSKKVIEKPRLVNLKKLADLICKKFDFDLVEIRYYNSIPAITDGAENYYKHMVFLAKLKKSGIKVQTRKLKVIQEKGVEVKVEKGVDVLICSDMFEASLLDKTCDVCILISGDADFLPAMGLVKKRGKEIISASVPNGYSRGLRSGDFRYFVLKKKNLESCFGGK